MKKIFFIALITLSTSFSTIESCVIYVFQKEQNVIIHKTCKGLSNCKHTIKKSFFNRSKRKGLTLCGWDEKLVLLIPLFTKRFNLK